MEDFGYSPLAIITFTSKVAKLTTFEQHNVLMCVSITDPTPALDVLNATVS